MSKKGNCMRGLSVVFVALIAIAVLFFIGLSRAPDMLAGKLSKKFGVPISIKSINFGFSDIDVREIEIGNPPNYNLPKAFSAEEIKISAPVTEFLKSIIEIYEIDIENIYLGIEFDTKTSTRGNWSKTFSNLQQRGGINKEPSKEVLVKKLVLKNIRTEVLFRDGSSTQQLPLIRQIVLTNVSTKGGIPTDQLVGSVLAQMLKEVFIRQNLNNMLKGIILDGPGKAVEKLVKPFEGFFNAIEHNDFEATD